MNKKYITPIMEITHVDALKAVCLAVSSQNAETNEDGTVPMDSKVRNFASDDDSSFEF